jgi:hypothetical protein
MKLAPFGNGGIGDNGGYGIDGNMELARDAHAARFLRDLCARPAAAPGSAMLTPLPWFSGGGFPSELTLRVPCADGRAGNAAAEHVRFAPLLFHITVDATLALFAALAFERRVIITGGVAMR